MAYDGGYIMLHRRIKHWKWFKEPATVVVWLTLLLSAEWRQGATLKPGQVALTQREIMELTGLSRQQIRTALKHLEATKEITVSATKGLTSQASLPRRTLRNSISSKGAAADSLKNSAFILENSCREKANDV